MKKLMLNSILLFILVIGLTGCFYDSNAHSPKYSEPEFSNIDGGYTRDISGFYFNKIVISGNIDATIENQQPTNRLVCMGTRNMRQSFKSRIRGRTLVLEYGNYPSNIASRTPIRVDLKLAWPMQKIFIDGDGRTRLKGDWSLSRLNVTGNAFCYAYWIDSTNLHVFAGDNAKVFLAGVANDLDIIARNNAGIDARNLKAENAYVRTQNDAQVGVSVRNSLSTLSTGGSTVYIYGDAPLDINYLGNRGSALHMAGIDR